MKVILIEFTNALPQDKEMTFIFYKNKSSFIPSSGKCYIFIGVTGWG